MDNQPLSNRHKRLLASMLFVLEKKINDIESLIHKKSENASYIVIDDLSGAQKQQIETCLYEIRGKISEIVNTYDLKKREIVTSVYISTIQSQMWEMLTDSLSGSLKGYGDHIVRDAKRIDGDIKRLLEMIKDFNCISSQ